MTWTIECKECGGPYWYGVCPCGWHGTADKASGGGPLGDTGDYGDVHCPACDREDELETGTCPTCKGAGGWWLGMEIQCLTCGGEPYGGYLQNLTGTCFNCNGKPKYRPLTVEEVSEMKGNLPSIFESLIKGDIIQFVYKGSPVRLIGRDNANDSD